MLDITKEELEKIINNAVEKELHKTLESLGVDVNEPLRMQRNMAYLDGQRQASEQVATWTRRIIWTTVITGILSVLGVGILHGIKQALGLR